MRQISSAKRGVEPPLEELLAEAVGGGVTAFTGAPVAPRKDWNGVLVGATVGVAVTPSRDSATTVYVTTMVAPMSLLSSAVPAFVPQATPGLTVAGRSAPVN